MRLTAVADLHGFLPDVEPCDVLVLGGDLTPATDHGLDFQEAWLDGPFREWLARVPATEVVGIAGNHDFLFERAPERVPSGLRWTYLECSGCEVAGLRFWGSPWTPWFFDWAFNAPRVAGEAFLEEQYRACPDDVDVLVVHGPPAGYGDRTSDGRAVGSTALRDLVGRSAPQLCVFGHIHEGRGAWSRGPTTLANVAAVDLMYELRAEPAMSFEVG